MDLLQKIKTGLKPSGTQLKKSKDIVKQNSLVSEFIRDYLTLLQQENTNKKQGLCGV
jgi:hypothetical protein